MLALRSKSSRSTRFNTWSPAKRRAALWLTPQPDSQQAQRPPPHFQVFQPHPAGRPRIHASQASQTPCAMNPSCVKCGESAKDMATLGISTRRRQRGQDGSPSVHGRTAQRFATLAAARHIGKLISCALTGRRTRLISESPANKFLLQSG